MVKDDATQQVLDLRLSVDDAKVRTTEARTKKKVAEDQLTAADDAIEQLGLDPDRDLARQVNQLVAGIHKDLGKLEEQLDEAQSVFA